ncbi:tRNA U34 5-carboxymethylaminomethyl modifying GTPase MnmE/TrmE [Massilia sp. UYP32]|uniref:GTPase n=1 Tax=Massilia sp. UYP32 TaxID=1756386 RepID=UPI003D19DFD6
MTYQEIQMKVGALASDKPAQKPVVVAYGLMNAGKSFLMNMLTQHVEQEFFKTNDVRETVVNARYEGDECVFLDTPGLDATEEDDEHAQRGAREGDIVLFVHQPQGELEAVELSFLEALRDTLDEHASSNIVVVLSKIDKEAAEKIDLIEQRVAEQCAEALGFAPRIFRVSGKRHQDGIRKGHAVLAAASGIDALAAHLRQLAGDVRAVRARKRALQIDALLAQVAQGRRSAQQEREALRDAVTAGFAAFNEQVAQLRRHLDASAAEYKKI